MAPSLRFSKPSFATSFVINRPKAAIEHWPALDTGSTKILKMNLGRLHLPTRPDTELREECVHGGLFLRAGDLVEPGSPAQLEPLAAAVRRASPAGSP
jgi:hypothetical protein